MKFAMNRLYIAAKEHLLRADESVSAEDLEFKWHWPVLALSMALSACASLLRGQDCTWDVLNYHVYSGFAFLNKPLNFDFAPAQVQSFFNPLMHVFSYLLLAHVPSRLAAATLGAIHGLNIYLVFQISQTLFRNWPSPLRFLVSICNAAAAGFGAIFILEVGTTFGDNLTSILILCGMLLMFRYFQSSEDKTPAPDYMLGIAGLILGVAVGLKITVAIFAAAIVVALPALLLASKHRIRSLLVLGGFMGLGFLAVYGFWGYNLYREYGNPIYPYMNTIFHSPFFGLRNMSDARFFPRTWQQTYFYPFFFAHKNHFVSEITFRDGRLAACYLTTILLAAAGLFRLIQSFFRTGAKASGGHYSRNLAFLALFFVVSYAAWEYQFSVYRYLIVLELLAPVFLSLAIAWFVKRKFTALTISVLLNLVICYNTLPADFGHQKFDNQFLKVKIPIMGDLEDSVVLMGGYEATSYIIPYFPASTRFVRISSNFTHPGQNPRLDYRIRNLLAQYDASHIYVYIARNEERERASKEASFYGITIDEPSCRAILSRAAEGGYICGTGGGFPHQLASLTEPKFQNIAGIRLDVSPTVVGEDDTILLNLHGLNLRAMDVLFTINGKLRPPQRKCYLDKQHEASFPISSDEPSGLYHFIGIRDSAAQDPSPWIRVDARALVR